MHNRMTACGDASIDKTASQRALELRKFFEPFHHITSPAWSGGLKATIASDGALDAFAETVLWRLRGVRTMVSLIDRSTQYFLAGAARQGKEHTDDLLLDRSWFGCNNISTSGGLCQNTLSLDCNIEKYPCFVVNDLLEDGRFAHLPVVNGSVMAYRFYAGTPITTAHGVNIGSFFIFDDRPRPEGLSLNQRRVLFEAAANVMRHLETKREAAERRRVSLMSKGIATFLETTSHVTGTDLDNTDGSELSRKSSTARRISSSNSLHSQPLAEERSDSDTKGEEGGESISKDPSTKVLDQIKLTLDHAADILRESLELSGGGVLFLDTALGSKDASTMNDYFTLGKNADTKTEELLSAEIQRGGSSPGQVRSFNDQYQPAKTLAMSLSETVKWNPSTKVPDGKTLQDLISTYPKGNVWYIDDEGYFSSIEQVDETYDGHTPSPSGKRRSRSAHDMTRQRAEADLLSRIFKNARQIIFLPLWDAGANRWYAGCFVWSQSAVPVFSVDPEIAYLSAFTNSMMVEISRLEAITANKMKSDFISSISHEFRSPLHGILASTEFLRDSNLDSMQAEFISTIQNCGSTLLDTINHVLDYSKINSFEKKGLELGSLSNELYQCSDVALLCEEIVYGMMAAKEFTGILESNSTHKPGSHHADHLHGSQVSIILDFEHRNWKYRIQSGAIRRVIMNIFGNASKYTEKGFIMVQLWVREAEQVNPATGKTVCKHVLVMRIVDTGRGMSTEYMERKLYTPFAQEDTFAPGIGLGLSIVWSIVSQLGGMIHIRSELGKGTEVEVSLPLERGDASTNCSSLARSDIEVHGSLEARKCVEDVQKIAIGKTVAIIRENVSDTCGHAYLEPKWQCIEKYFSTWFGFTIIDPDDRHDLANVDLVIGEKDGNYIRSHLTVDMDIHRILLIRDGMTCVLDRKSYLEKASVENIWNPIGPYKLARAVLGLFKNRPEDKTVIEKPSLAVPVYDSEQARISSPSSGSSTPMSSTKQSMSEHLSTGNVDANEVSRGLTPTVASHLVIQSESLKTLDATKTIVGIDENQGVSQTLKNLEPLLVPISEPVPQESANETLTPVMRSPQIEDNTSLRVLAVDDNILNLQLLHRYLIKRPNDVVVTARNGVEAVAAVRQTKIPFDIILMDLSMPEMDGFEATRLIRVFEKSLKHREASEIEEELFVTENGMDVAGHLERDTKKKAEDTEMRAVSRQLHAYIVALTGLASRRDRDEAEESGFDDFLTKPISFGKIGELLVRKSAEKGAQNMRGE